MTTVQASLTRFFDKGFGSSRTPQRLSLFTSENLIAWLASDGLAIKPLADQQPATSAATENRPDV